MMRRSRRGVKRLSSNSSDDEPLIKKTTKTEPKIPELDGSSSESDIENYLQPINKIDLNSSFFDVKRTSTEPSFDKIEKDIFAGVSHLSSSDDESLKAEIIKTETVAKLNFQKLHEYTKKMDEAKLHVERYNAKKREENDKIDIVNMLVASEPKLSLENEEVLGDLHSSDFESCSDSEKEGWEEVEETQKSVVPKEGLQITVEMPNAVRKKKGVDLLAAVKRRLNRIRKENQLLIHKVHLLCWIAHGNYVNSVINNEKILATSLSLLPSEKCYPSDRVDLKYLEQLLQWYRKSVKIVQKPVPVDLSFEQLLQSEIAKKEVYNKENLVFVFVAILRSLGIQCRVVFSFQVEPLRPSSSELCSLSTKTDSQHGKTKNKSPSTSKSRGEVKTSTSKGSPSTSCGVSKNLAGPSTSGGDPKIASSSRIRSQKSKIEKKDISLLVERESKKTGPASSAKGKTKNEVAINVSSKVLRDRSKATAQLGSKKEIKNERIEEEKLRTRRSKSTSTQPVILSVEAKLRSKSSSDNLKKSPKFEQKKRATKIDLPLKKLTAGSKSTSGESSTNPKPRARRSKSTSTQPVILPVEAKLRSKSSSDNLKKSKSEQEGATKIGLPLKKLSVGSKSTSGESSTNPGVDKKSRTKSSSDSSKSVLRRDVIKIKLPEKTSRTARTLKQKTISQVDGVNDSDSEDSDSDLSKNQPLLGFDSKGGAVVQLDGSNEDDNSKVKKESKPNLKKLRETKRITCPVKTHTPPKPVTIKYRDTDSEDDFRPDSPFTKKNTNRSVNLRKLTSQEGVKFSSPIVANNSNYFGNKPQDVRNDIVRLVKGRIKEQKAKDRSKIVKKRKTRNDTESDSDYAPEPIAKKPHDSDDDFVPKTKVKQRVQPKSQLILNDNGESSKKRKGVNVWAEVFLENEEKWICVDVIQGQVHCVQELYARADHPVSYVVAWNNDNSLKDITRRYCQNFNTATRKLRIDAKWWQESIEPFLGKKTARDREEDDELERQQLEKPLPTSISEYKNHPLYVLKRHLLKFESIYPPDAPTLGFVRKEPVYSRQCVYTLHSRDIWLKHAKTVKLGEKPYKIVKARPKYDRLSNTVITDQLLEIFGPWQTEDYVPPTAENGVVPRNAFGNVELFKACMLPKKTVHLKLPGLNKIARRMNIDCASAIVGFDFHSGWSHPTYDGFVVCEEFADILVAAWELEQEENEKKELEKVEKRVYGNWRKLIRGLLIRERLKAKYDFGEPSGGGELPKKKGKGPRFATKKRRVQSDSGSESD